MRGTSEPFYALHFLTFVWAQVAGKFFTNGRSVFLEYSSKDLHLSTKDKNARDVYASLDSQAERYLGITLSDAFLQDFLVEARDRRKEVNLVELFSLFPELDGLVANARLGKVQLLLPDLVEAYGPNAEVSVLLSPSSAPEEHVKYTKTANKVIFKKDALELLVSTYFDLIVKNDQGVWEGVRQGFIGIGAKSTLSLATTEDAYNLVLKPSGIGVKKITLLDPSVEDEEDRVMDNESSLILGIANLMAKKYIKPLDFSFKHGVL